MNKSSFDTFVDVMLLVPKPVLVHCNGGYEATLFSLLYAGVTGSIYYPEIYSVGLTLGYDYQYDATVVDYINLILGMNTVPTTSPAIELTLAKQETSYRDYYWVHRMGNDQFYNVGQVLSTHVNVIKDAGYASIINFRADGEQTNKLPSESYNSGYLPNDEFSAINGNYNLTAERTAFDHAGYSNSYYSLPVTVLTPGRRIHSMPTYPPSRQLLRPADQC